jgi:hypothetical protein
LEQEVVLLRAVLNDALGRIGRLEQRVGMLSQSGFPVSCASGEFGHTGETQRTLIPIDSPAMMSALQLCAEIFPGGRTKVETLTDPDDPERSWRHITVYWSGSPRQGIDLQSVWHNRFDALHPEAIHNISLFVVPE